LACGSKVRKDALTFWWQAPQVLARLSLCTLERGSEAGRLWCGVWQSAQAAAFLLFSDVALPWKLSLKVASRLVAVAAAV
jgi:hypothetical protein